MANYSAALLSVSERCHQSNKFAKLNIIQKGKSGALLIVPSLKQNPRFVKTKKVDCPNFNCFHLDTTPKTVPEIKLVYGKLSQSWLGLV